MNANVHANLIDDQLDALACDPDVTDEEYIEVLQDTAQRCTASAQHRLRKERE